MLLEQQGYAYLAAAATPLAHALLVLTALTLRQLLHTTPVRLAALVLSSAPPVLLL